MITAVSNNYINPADPSYSSDQQIIAEYQALFQDFLNSNGSKEAAGALYAFIENNQNALLKAMKDVDYSPDPLDTDPAANLLGLKMSLQGYLDGSIKTPDPIYEFGNDVGIWLGINLSPEQVLQGFEALMRAFEANPGANAKTLEWFLSTKGYMKTADGLAKDPAQFNQLIQQAQRALAAYQNDPTKADLAIVDRDLQKIFNSF